MNKKRLTIFFIILAILIVGAAISSQKNEGLISPNLAKTVTNAPVATPTPTKTPKTFNFDKSTDLKAELEKINPQILDSDFTE